MPAMPRTSSKATKIAYRILGVPANIQYKPTKRQKRINKRLVLDETTRVR